MIKHKISVIGLGYVGLPLATELSKVFETVGFDNDLTRINELSEGFDRTKELDTKKLKSFSNLKYSSEINDIKESNIFIITVPTPIDQDKKPDLGPLEKASEMVGSILKKDDIVIYESTVYPGATEEFCVPILEKISGLTFNKDFFSGYSPERINPGDKEHTIKDIKKITSGSTPKVAEEVNNIYKSIISAGTHLAESIKVAEAAKVIENTQRDINIALINELSIIFNKLGIDTRSVLEAAETKWNFLPFKPGLVGGHCIGVDPYYLTFRAQKEGYIPEIILAGRKLNDSMPEIVSNQIFDLLAHKSNIVQKPEILVLGLTFKENCPDLRNSKIFDLIDFLNKGNCNIDVYDPWVEVNTDKHNFNFISYPKDSYYDVIVLAVAHEEFKKMGIEKIKSFGKTDSIYYEIKYLFNNSEIDGRL